MNNLEMAYPEKSGRERSQIADGVFVSIARLLAAFARFPVLNRGNISAWIRYEGLEHYWEAKKLARGVLFATAQLDQRGVDLRGMVTRDGPTFRWHGRYHEDMNVRDTLSLELNVFADFTPDLLPDQRRADYVFLANISPQLQQHVLSQVASPKVVAADTMNHWIENDRAALIKLLPRNVGINWDSLNGLALGEKPYPDGYESLPKDRNWNVHVKGKSLLDYPEHQDWPAILSALERDGFTGRLELETHIFGDQQVAASHASMKEIMRLLTKNG